MGFLAPALPWLIKGGAALGGALFGKKSQSAAGQRSPEEAMALGGAQGASAGLMSGGQALTNLGVPAARKSIGYWQTLLGGSRAAMAQATAGPRGAITDVYRGAERGLERSGVQGASRDRAEAELNRDRAGQISGLTTGVQPMAAGALGDLGMSATSTGLGAYGNAGSIWSSLLGQGAKNREYARGEGEKSGSSIGKLIFDILSGGGGKGNTGYIGKDIGLVASGIYK
jgi:hypothetical protein